MARPTSKQPTDGEMEILQALWRLGSTGLGDLCGELRKHRAVATTTVATRLKIMLDKGLVHRVQGPSGYLWSANKSLDEARSSLLGGVIERVFEGSAQNLVLHLLDHGQLGKKDLEEIQSLFRAADEEIRGSDQEGEK